MCRRTVRSASPGHGRAGGHCPGLGSAFPLGRDWEARWQRTPPSCVEKAERGRRGGWAQSGVKYPQLGNGERDGEQPKSAIGTSLKCDSPARGGAVHGLICPEPCTRYLKLVS